MIIENKIACADIQTNADLRIIDVEIQKDLQLLVEFSNGEKRIFDVNKILNYPVYENLKKYEVFKNVSLKKGILVWEDENIDIGTDFVYENSEILE